MCVCVGRVGIFGNAVERHHHLSCHHLLPLCPHFHPSSGEERDQVYPVMYHLEKVLDDRLSSLKQITDEDGVRA